MGKLDCAAAGVTDLPLTELLTEVLGTATKEARPSRPRTRTAAQIWSKDHFHGTIQNEFNK